MCTLLHETAIWTADCHTTTSACRCSATAHVVAPDVYETAVQPTAEALRKERQATYWRIQESEELTDEAERLNQRWSDLE